MTEDSRENTVLLRRCEEYDRRAIGEIVKSGMAELGFRPRGRVFVKPNVVFANRPDKYGRHAYTDPAVVGASLKALAGAEGVARVDMGENAAIGMPTRMSFKYAGYYDEVKAVRREAPRPVGIFCIDEERRDSVFVGGKVHDNLRLARKMARADCKVYLPKLKCHCVSNMTGAVKLNIGVCSDDERSIRHDFLLDEKIADLLAVGRPDFTVMDAVEVGVGNEAMPTPRKLGLVLMGRNPVAVDLVAARLLGFNLEDVPYLKAVVDRGWRPASLAETPLAGDITSLEALDEHARRLLPYDEEYTRWQDVHRELERLKSTIRFVWGPYNRHGGERCRTGCVMGLKMFLAFFEAYAGPEVFAQAKPVVFVIGKTEEEIDAAGAEVFLIGSCASASGVRNAKKIKRIDKCFTTAGDMMQTISYKLGMPSPFLDRSFLLSYLGALSAASLNKLVRLRYFQDMGHFLTKSLVRRI